MVIEPRVRVLTGRRWSWKVGGRRFAAGGAWSWRRDLRTGGDWLVLMLHRKMGEAGLRLVPELEWGCALVWEGLSAYGLVSVSF